jgi:hypothetical protein
MARLRRVRVNSEGLASSKHHPANQFDRGQGRQANQEPTEREEVNTHAANSGYLSRGQVTG